MAGKAMRVGWASVPAVLVAVLAASVLGVATRGAAAQGEAPPACRADLVVAPGGACIYPGTDHRFVVDLSGRARFLFLSSADKIDVPGWPVDGLRYHFSAWSQGDGSWLVEQAGEPAAAAARAAAAWNAAPDPVALADGHDTPAGMWCDAASLWLVENETGAADTVHGYPLEGSERGDADVVALAAGNAVARGVWSDGATLWVSDSGLDHVFAYSVAGGARDEGRELGLAAGNAEARGLWSDGRTLWVLDAGAGALFAYELDGGSPLGRHGLDPANATAHGLWSDGTTVWVSDHRQARLFAYRLPEAPDDPAQLQRAYGDDLAALAATGNGSPRGVCSDGRIMHVADANDDRVYSYHMPERPGAVVRWEVAVMMVRQLDGEDPRAQPSRFADVDADLWWAPHVERLAELEVTMGCRLEPLRFCPHDPVTRAQAATLLVRGLGLDAATEPAGFADTDGSVHADDIDALHAAGVTAGCSREPLQYCPQQTITHQQMAALLNNWDNPADPQP